MAERRAYHHGNLREALLDEASVLIAADGPQGFSLAEAARRAGVSAGAPYRHFADREELVAAVAARGYDAVADALQAARNRTDDPAERLAAMAAAYVTTMAASPSTYAVLFASGIDKRRHPAIQAAAGRSFELLLGAGRDVVGEQAAESLATAAGVVAHGYATSLLDGHLGDDPGAAQRAAAQARAAVRALVLGRAALTAAG